MKLNKHFLVFNYFIFSLIAFFISNNTTAQIDGGIAEYNASLERNANYNPCDILFGCSTAFVEAGDSDPPSPTIKSVTKGWMGKLPDTIPMNRISIPGTHDSGTRYTLPVANTQNWTIKEQLEAGIRQFDLRVRTGFDSENLFFDNCFDNACIVDTGVIDSPTEMSNSCCGNITGWDIYHGAIPNGDGSGKVLTFDQVFDWMTEFLNKKENEKEALIVNIQTAESGKGDPFEKLYAHYQTKYSGFWITPSNSKFKSPAGVITIPKLGDLRKKIFVINKQPELLTFNSWGGQANCGFSCDLRGATDHLDSAPGDPDPNIWYKTTFDLLPPSVMAPNSNRLLFEYLNTLSSKTPLGIISSDFPGEGLIYRIIKTNFNFKKRIDYSIRIDCGGRAYGESQNDVTVNFYNGTELLDSVIKKPNLCYIFNDTEFNITAVVPARDQELTYVNKYGEVKVISVPITHITIEIDGEDDVFIDQIRLSEKKFVPNILYPENGSDDLATDEVVFSWGVSGGSGWCLSDNVGPYDCSGLECAFGIGRGFPSCTDCASAWRFEVGCSIYYATNIGGEMDSFMGNQITSNKDLDIWEQTYSFDCIPPPAPVAVCQDFTLELNEDGKGALSPTNIDGGSYTDDYPDLSLSYQISREDFTCNDVGIHEITLTVENSGGTDTCLATVTVVDNIPPQVLTKPITVYLDENGSVSITPSQIDNGSNDACGIGSLSVNPNVFNCGDIGENTVTLTVTDNNNNTATNTAIVTVLDDILPVLTVITDPITLWPPNHKYQTIDVSELVVSVTDNCAQLTADDVYITRITSDEPENSGGNSDGNTMDDIVIDSDCHSVDLRKERRGNGNGRVYTIYLEVEDGNGNYDRATIKVHIPHNNNGVSVDDGMVYEETCSTGRSSNNGFKLSLDSVKDNNSSLRIYPNPSKSYFTIKLESMKSSDNMQIQIYDINGRGVYYSQGQTNQEYHVNVALQAGLYFVYVTHGNESQVVKLVRY